MKIANVTLVVSTAEDGVTSETKAVDPNFVVGLSYPIPELGPGLWTVTEIGAPSTNFIGGKSIATTRVSVEPAAPGSTPASTSVAPPSTGGAFKTKSNARPIPRPTQKARHTPK